MKTSIKLISLVVSEICLVYPPLLFWKDRTIFPYIGLLFLFFSIIFQRLLTLML